MKMIKNVLILAGGVSRRFWPLTNKPLFEFLGKPLLFYQIEELKKYAENIFIVCHKNSVSNIKRLVENAAFSKIRVVTQQGKLKGQAGAVLTVGDQIHGEALIVNANDFLDFSALTKITNEDSGTEKIVLFGKKLNEYFSGGYFKFDNKERPIEVVEKPAPDKRPSNIAKLMMDYFSNFGEFVKAIKKIKTTQDDHYERALNSLLAANPEKKYFHYDSYWQSLKYPWHVLAMLKIILLTIKEEVIPSSCQISKKAHITGLVVFGENVKVGDFAKIVGPAYIGDNSVIGDYSLVRESQIGRDCLIGGHSEVARSSIGNGVFLHRNYVGDTIIDNQAMMGAGAITANFRFDAGNIFSFVKGEKIDTNMGKFGAVIGEGSKVGVNATLAPGVKIGRNCLVAPNETVRVDIKDNIFFINGKERLNLNK